MFTIPVISSFLYFFFGLLILTKKDRTAADKILSLYFFISSIIFALAAAEIYNRQSGYPFPWLINTSTPFILLIGPLLWFYVKTLTTQNLRIKPAYAIHLLPFLVVFTIFLFNIYLIPENQKILADAHEELRHGIFYPLVIATIATSNIGYTVAGIILLRQYRRRIRYFFSHTETLDLNWLRHLLLMALFFYALISTLYISDYLLNLMPYGLLQGLGFSFISLFSVLLGFFGLRQGNLFNPYIKLDLNKISTQNTDYYNCPLSGKDEAFINRLLDYVKTQKPYLNPDINLAGLSEQLGVSPEYLSEIINSRLNKNFFDFINFYRIEEFKKRCNNPQNKNYTIIGLAFDCGFNSKATFNRVFKKSVGVTPSEYCKMVSKS